MELKREETGKLFPVTDSARTVLEALLRRCRELGVDVRAGHRVRAVRRADGGASAATAFAIDHATGTLPAARVIVATGGRSLPRTGSDGAGWDMVRSLGHTVSETHPALVPLILERAIREVPVRRRSASP